MLNENIKAARKAKGLSQEELAVKLGVVRQTVSKWEQALSVPDAGLLCALSEALETPVSTLLGETAVEQPEAEDLRAIREKLEVVNLQLAGRREAGRRAVQWLLAALCVGIAGVFAALWVLQSPYLGWDLSDPETAVAGTFLHGFEWLFVRLAPPVFLTAAAGLFLTRRRR